MGGAQVTSFFDPQLLLVLYRYIFLWYFEATKQIEKMLGSTLIWSMLIFWYLPATKGMFEDSCVFSNPGSTRFWPKYQNYLGLLIRECVCIWILCMIRYKFLIVKTSVNFQHPSEHDHAKAPTPSKKAPHETLTRITSWRFQLCFIFIPGIPWETIQFDEHIFSNGLKRWNQPPSEITPRVHPNARPILIVNADGNVLLTTSFPPWTTNVKVRFEKGWWTPPRRRFAAVEVENLKVVGCSESFIGEVL